MLQSIASVVQALPPEEGVGSVEVRSFFDVFREWDGGWDCGRLGEFRGLNLFFSAEL